MKVLLQGVNRILEGVKIDWIVFINSWVVLNNRIETPLFVCCSACIFILLFVILSLSKLNAYFKPFSQPPSGWKNIAVTSTKL